jgi:cell shape-determining protein MreD
VLGLAADSVAGSPFGLNTTSYVWICFGVYQAKSVLEVSNLPILFAVCMICVLFENLVLTGFTLITRINHPFTMASLGVIGLQLIWVLVTGPPLFFIFNRIAPATDEKGYAY